MLSVWNAAVASRVTCCTVIAAVTRYVLSRSEMAVRIAVPELRARTIAISFSRASRVTTVVSLTRHITGWFDAPGSHDSRTASTRVVSPGQRAGEAGVIVPFSGHTSTSVSGSHAHRSAIAAVPTNDFILSATACAVFERAGVDPVVTPAAGESA